MIETFTAGYYIHCAIYVGDGKIVEALKNGVQEVNLNERINEYAYIAVTRMYRFTDDAKEKMVKAARDFIGCKYNISGAICAPKNEEKYVITAHNKIGQMFSKAKKIKKPKRVFCSQLIMECIRKSEVLIDEQLSLDYFQSENWTPTGLAKYGYGDFLKFIGYIVHNKDYFNYRDYFSSNTMYQNYHNLE